MSAGLSLQIARHVHKSDGEVVRLKGVQAGINQGALDIPGPLFSTWDIATLRRGRRGCSVSRYSRCGP